MGILLNPTWFQDDDGTIPPAQWKAKTQTVTVDASSPAAARFVGTVALPDGTPVTIGGTTVPGGFSTSALYYVIAVPSIDEFTFGLSPTLGGQPIVASDAGTGVTVTDLRYYLGLGAAPPSPFPDGDVILLFHFDGTAHSTTIVDSSSYGETDLRCVYYGGILTDHPQFGTGAFSGEGVGAPGSSGAVMVGAQFAPPPLVTRYQIQPGKDFTVEASVRQPTPNASDNGQLFGMFNETMTEAALTVRVLANSGLINATMFDHSNINVLDITGVTSINDGNYHAVSFERMGTTCYLYVDGVLEAIGIQTGAIPQDMVYATVGMSRPGDGNEDKFAGGQIDEVRYVNGYAVHQGATSYTPATGPFPDPGSTPPTSAAVIQYIGQLSEQRLQNGLFGMMRLRYDIVQAGDGPSTFYYDTGAGPVHTTLSNVVGDSGIISICLDGVKQLDWGISSGSNNGIIAFGEAPGDSTYGNVNFNCMCPELPVFETLSALRNRLMLRLGFGAQVANPPPGMTALLNEFLQSAQNFLWKKYPATFTRRLFTWPMQQGERFYGMTDNTDDVYRNLRADFTKGVEWSGIYDPKNTWTPIFEGITPELYTMVTQFGRPVRYEIRECIEVFPPPDGPYTLVFKTHIALQDFAADGDTTTIDSEVVYLTALAQAKAHYGQADTQMIANLAKDYLGQLIAATHLNARYIPGAHPVLPIVKPQLLQFQDGT